MALGKRVKEGGSFYKGYSLPILGASGDTTLFMAVSSGGCAINSIAIIPDVAGVGDTIKLENVQGTAGSTVIATLGESLPNMGAGIPISLDFICLEKVLPGNSLKLTYTNTSLNSVTAYIIVERGR